jgi:hypothetical protein
MFLAREPLMDLAGKVVGGKKGKSRKRGKAKAEAAPKEEKAEAS